MAQDKYVVSTQYFQIEIYENSSDGLTRQAHCQLTHIPLVGDFFIPVGSKEMFKISAVIHEDRTTCLVIEKYEGGFAEIAKTRYSDKKESIDFS